MRRLDKHTSRTGSRALISGALAALLLAPPTAAQERKDAAESNLSRLEEQIAKSEKEKADLEQAAEKAAAEARQLSEDLVEVAKELRFTEQNALRLEQRISDLEAEASHKKETLETRRVELLKLLSALERLSARPAVFTFLQPEEALNTARSASLMGELVPNINARAAALRTELSALASIQEKLSAERFTLKNTLAELTQHQLKLASLLDRRKAEAADARAAAEQTSRELMEFARKAKSLKDLIDKLEQQAAKQAAKAPVRVSPVKRSPVAPGGKPIAQMKGLLPYPAAGTLVSRFGEKEAAGHAKGIKIAARKGAQIVSPYDGQIVFAGPFRGYGHLVIIAHGNGYHSLLAGLADLQAAVGQWVLMGEPVGKMPDRSEREELYLEMRHEGDAVDPLPWLSRQTASAK